MFETKSSIDQKLCSSSRMYIYVIYCRIFQILSKLTISSRLQIFMKGSNKLCLFLCWFVDNLFIKIFEYQRYNGGIYRLSFFDKILNLLNILRVSRSGRIYRLSSFWNIWNLLNILRVTGRFKYYRSGLGTPWVVWASAYTWSGQKRDMKWLKP